MPTVIFYGDNDGLVSIQDVQKMISEMPNVPHSYQVAAEGWNHNDFVYGKSAPELVYDVMIGHFDEFLPETLPNGACRASCVTNAVMITFVTFFAILLF